MNIPIRMTGSVIWCSGIVVDQLLLVDLLAHRDLSLLRSSIKIYENDKAFSIRIKFNLL